MKKLHKLLSAALILTLLLGFVPTALAAGGVKPVILTVCRGTEDESALEQTVAAAEKSLLRANPRYEIRRAFLSEEAAEATETDTLDAALDRLAEDGVTSVILCPLMLTPGEDYRAMTETAAEREAEFDSLKVGLPLVSPERDSELAAAMTPELARWERAGTALVFVAEEGEDSEALSLLQDALHTDGHLKCFVGRGEDVAPVLEALEESGVQRALILPMTLYADEEAMERLAPWRSALEDEGYEVETVARSFGEYTSVREMFITGVKKAVSAAEALAALPEREETETEEEEPRSDKAAVPAEEPEEEPSEEPEEEPAEEPEEEPAEEPAEEPEEEPAEEPEEEPKEEPAEEPEEEPKEEPEEEKPADEPEDEGAALVAGTYSVRVLTSSSRFTVKSAQLSAAGGKMVAVITLQGRDYGEMYAGTAAEAETAPEEELIPFQWNGEGEMTFTLPVEALDTELRFAVWSIRRGCWLDRLLIFDSSTLPVSALK